VHCQEYILKLKNAVEKAAYTKKTQTLMQKDKETKVGSESWKAATTAVAIVLSAVKAVLTGGATNAFCGIRPPGHHSGIGKQVHYGNGFCLLNNAAAGAIYALKEQLAEKVVILDFDVHHGNGTEEIVAQLKRDDIMFISFHVMGLDRNGMSVYPHTGSDIPHGNVLNLPMERNFRYEDIDWKAIQEKIANFQPDLFILSAGFDGHKDDPMKLGKMEAKDFGRIITEEIGPASQRFADKAVVSILEGGYETTVALPSSVEAHIQGLIIASKM